MIDSGLFSFMTAQGCFLAAGDTAELLLPLRLSLHIALQDENVVWDLLSLATLFSRRIDYVTEPRYRGPLDLTTSSTSLLLSFELIM